MVKTLPLQHELLKRIERAIAEKKENLKFAKSWLKNKAWFTQRGKFEMESAVKSIEAFINTLENLTK